MTTAPGHVIGTQSILLGYGREDTAPALLEQTGDLWRSRLAPAAEQVFSACCPAGEHIRLDLIELDLGTIPEAAFVEEFPDRFKRALTAALSRQIAQLRAGDHDGEGRISASPEGAALDILEHLFLTGALPWWAPEGTEFDPPRELTDTLDRLPYVVAALAKKTGRHRHVRQRLVHWLADPAIADLIRAVAPGDASFILRYADDLDTRQREERFVSADPVTFRHAKWEIILGHLLADAGSRFNAKSFLRQTLAALAGRFRLSYAFLLGELARLATHGEVAWRESSLPQLLTEIYEEDLRPLNSQLSALSSQLNTPAGESGARIARALALWDAALASEANASPDQAHAGLAFWSHLSAAEAHAVSQALLARHGATRVQRQLSTLFTPAERTAFQDTLTAPPGSGDSATDDTPESYAAALALEETLTRALDAWSEELSQEPSDPPTPERLATLAFWRELPTAAVQRLVTTLLARHGQARLAARLTAFFPEAQRAELYAHLGEHPLVSSTESAAVSGFSSEKPADPHTTGGLVMPALRELLETGRLPVHAWTRPWQDRRESWLYLVLTRQADALPAMLRAWHRARPLTEKLTLHFNDRTLGVLVETLAPAHAEEVTGFVQNASRAHRAEPVAAGVSHQAFHRSAWNVVLDYLLSDHGSVFNRLMFVEQSIQALAARHNLHTAAALDFLHAAATQEGSQPLLHDLTELKHRYTRRQTAQATSSPESSAAEAAAKTARQPAPHDLTELAPLHAQPSSTPPTPAPETLTPESASASFQEAATASVFSRENLQRSPAARLRLWLLILQNAPQLKEPALHHVLPLFWPLLARSDASQPWRELAHESAEASGTVRLMLATGGESTLAALLFAGATAEAAAWTHALDWLVAAPAAASLFPSGRTELRVRLWTALLELWRETGGQPLHDVAGWLVRVLARLARHEGRSTQGAPHDETTVLAALRTALVRDGGTAASTLTGHLRTVVPRKTPPAPSSPHTRPPVARTPATPSTPPPPPAPAKNPTVTESRIPERIAVSNAGLVLLAPFFASLFQRCGWLEEKLFRDFEAAQRAVHLLQFLVAGGHRAHEYTLVLNKLLCGLDPHVAVVARVELTEEEKNTATQLLASTAVRWPRGAFISPDGLRSSFLNRPGRLEHREKGWHLKVERRGWDVLLPELDWTFPGPRPAWMPEPLEVDWI